MHSAPQLILLAEASRRLQARQALLALEVTQAAAAARNVKDPRALFKKLAATLEKQSHA